MKKFLHVGCGPKRKNQTTQGFNDGTWEELRFDIDETVKPDIVGTMLDMSAVADASVDAIFSSHNIEHLFPYEVMIALAEFKRVLKPEGFLVLTCPDLQSVSALIAEGKLLEPAYHSLAGPISPLDILYGHRPALAQGNHYMAHKSGFTKAALATVMQQAGFGTAAVKSRGMAPYFDLWIVVAKGQVDDASIRALAAAHFPREKAAVTAA